MTIEQIIKQLMYLDYKKRKEIMRILKTRKPKEYKAICDGFAKLNLVIK